jgi:hypothetical protein
VQTAFSVLGVRWFRLLDLMSLYSHRHHLSTDKIKQALSAHLSGQGVGKDHHFKSTDHPKWLCSRCNVLGPLVIQPGDIYPSGHSTNTGQSGL